MPGPSLSSPLSPSSPHSGSHLHSQQQQEQKLYPYPVLRITTIPYDSHSSHSHGRSSLLWSTLFARPNPRAITRFFTSIFVALGILFLWLLFVQTMRIVAFGHGGFPWGPHVHHGELPRHDGGDWRASPVVVKPSFGRRKPYVPAYSTRYSSGLSATPTSAVLPTPTEVVTASSRFIVTADR